MRIIRLQAENIKKLKAVEIIPEGPVVQLTGANGSGKSSVLDAIEWALAGAKTIDAQPVRKGQATAHVVLDLGDMKVTRRFAKSGTSTLTVEAASGARFPSPQAMLDALLGKLSFDPLAFARMDPKGQLQALKGVVRLDVDVDQLDGLNLHDYEQRTARNRQAKDLEAQISGIAVDPDLPTALVDEGALLRQMETASATNAEIEQRRAHREALQRSATRRAERARQLLAEAAALQAESDEDFKRLLAAEDLPPLVDVGDLRQQVEGARAINLNVAKVQARDELVRRLATVLQQAESLTQAMAERTAQKAAAIARADMPVEGLAFGDGEVVYNGLPFAQASSAEQLRVSIALAMAANPTLRVLRVKDGGLLDDASLAVLHSMAEAHDFQVWIETAGTHRPGIVMEDGEVLVAEPVADAVGLG